ncbi:hypothetical protein KC324_g16129 [Hortaea werneckii]|nr:hypothetical protein KC324_g16129 [Hortaea werneckii]
MAPVTLSQKRRIWICRANNVTGGKGTPRRKMKKVHKSSGTDDKKLNVQPITAIEEVNMFKQDGNVIHFSAPKGKFYLSPA